MSRFYCSFIFIVLFSSSSYGQNKYFPVAYRIGVDLTGIGFSILRPDHQHYELNNDFQFQKYLFSFDLGSTSRTFERDVPNEEFIYKYSGGFFRVGIDYNFIPKDPDDNAIFFGIRYGRAYFNDVMHLTVADDIFGTVPYMYENDNLRGRWLEANAGMKVKIWRNIFLGYTLRLKFAAKVKGETNLAAYEIPGYGKAAKSSVFGFNYHIFYRIPLRR